MHRRRARDCDGGGEYELIFFRLRYANLPTQIFQRSVCRLEAQKAEYEARRSQSAFQRQFVASRPAPAVEEAIIEGIRMLVILGDEVDTVIQYARGVMNTPQSSFHEQVAEEAARADTQHWPQRLRRNANWRRAKPTGRLIGNSQGRKQQEKFGTRHRAPSVALTRKPLVLFSRMAHHRPVDRSGSDSTLKIYLGRRRRVNAVRALDMRSTKSGSSHEPV